MKLFIHDDKFSILQYAPDDVPDIEHQSDSFFSLTKTNQEISVVCKQGLLANNKVPQPLKINDDWVLIEVDGPLDFSLTGVLSSIIEPLGKQGISIFSISTFDTDYILVKANKIDSTIAALKEAQFEVLSV